MTNQARKSISNTKPNEKSESFEAMHIASISITPTTRVANSATRKHVNVEPIICIKHVTILSASKSGSSI